MLKNIAESICAQVNNQILGREALTELAVTAFFAGGHIMLCGPTGLGKSRWAKAFTKAAGGGCRQIRLTSDTNHDEIFNRSADFVIAISEEPLTLPEALKDRFMMKLHANYPGVAAEKLILQMHHLNETPSPAHTPAFLPEALALARQEVQAVAVEDSIFNYIISIVETTRRINAVQTGVSIRGGIALLNAAKAHAAIKGRDHVIYEDVKYLAQPVLNHRINLRPDAIKEGLHPDRILESIVTGR